MMEDNCKERELWDLAFHSWIENSGLGGDQSSTSGFKEARFGFMGY